MTPAPPRPGKKGRTAEREAGTEQQPLPLLRPSGLFPFRETQDKAANLTNLQHKR